VLATAILVILLHPLVYGDPAALGWQRTAVLFFWFVAGACWRMISRVEELVTPLITIPRFHPTAPVIDLTGCRLD